MYAPAAHAQGHLQEGQEPHSGQPHLGGPQHETLPGRSMEPPARAYPGQPQGRAPPVVPNQGGPAPYQFRAPPPPPQPFNELFSSREFSALLGFVLCASAMLFWFWIAINHIPALLLSLLIVPQSLGGFTYTLYILTPVAVPLFELGGFFVYIYFSMVFLSIVLSLFWLFFGEARGFIKECGNFLSGRRAAALDTDNGILLIPQVFMAVMFFSVVYFALLYALGINFQTPSVSKLDVWEFVFALMDASFYEEVAARVLLVGVPMFLFAALFGRGTPPKKLYRYIFGGGFEIDRLAACLIILSAAVFASAHVLYGWDYYKAPQTFVVGIALAYLFLKKGLHAAIILHFSIDFITVLSSISSRWQFAAPLGFLNPAAFALSWASYIAMAMLVVVGIFVGPLYFLFLSKKAAKHFMRLFAGRADSAKV